MTDFAVEAHSLSKRFKLRSERRTSLKERLVRGREPAPPEFWALRDATFSVARGSSMGIIGQNGSGKSTALKVLAGIYQPTSGVVRVNGRVSALLEVGAGFHPELTGRENIRLNATILGFTGREIDLMMDEIVEFADIGDHIDGPIKHYSSGMYVRLGFAVAVMVRPEVLLVDEVIAVGDEEFQRKCYEYLYDLRRAGTSMIIVSHGLSQITDLCDEAMLLEHGRVRELGPSAQVVRGYLDLVNEREIDRSTAARVAHDAGDAVGPHDIDSGDGAEVEGHQDQSDETQDRGTGSTPQGRRGSGELRITSVEILDRRDEPTTVLLTGEPATFRFRFRAERALEDVVLGVGVDDHAMRTVWGVNTRHLPSVSIPAGEGLWEFRCGPLLSASGTYVLRVVVLTGSHLIDALDGGVSFHVRPSDVEMDGTYYQPGDWSLRLVTTEGVSAGDQVPNADSEVVHAGPIA